MARLLLVFATAVFAVGTARPADPPLTLKPGKWAVNEWLWPASPRHDAVITVAEKDGRPAITAVGGDTFKWEAKNLAVAGRRVTFTITREGPYEPQFEGLLDPADPTRVRGSLWADGASVDRATLDLVPPAGTPKRKPPEPPAEWNKYLELARETFDVELRADGPEFKKKPEAEQRALKEAAARARERYTAEAPKLFRKIVADRPSDPFAHEATVQLFAMLKDVKPPAEEVDAWAKAARTFAATHGPRYEAATLGTIARRLAPHAMYAAQARTYAAEADRLAKEGGMPVEHAARVSEWEAERTAWAAQPKPPAAGETWTVTISGKVTDPKGNPVAGAEVAVNNTQWAKVLTEGDGYKTKTGPDGRYTLPLRCQGTFRLHVTKMWAEKRGFVRVEDADRHALLPGASATVNFTLTPGEPFGGTLKLRPDASERDDPKHKSTHFLHVTGPGVEESVLATNGETFELTLPPGTYTVELPRGGGKKLTWSNLKTGKTDHVLEQAAFRFTPETVGAGFDELWQAMDRHYSYFTLKPNVDWAKLRDEYRPKAIKAKSADELAAVLKEMLAHLKDGHVWMEMPDGKFVGTHRTPWSYNGNRKVTRDQLTDVTECGEYAVVGKTKADGFGYFLMTHQSAATPGLVAKAVAAIGKLADAPGFVIDLRNANGGSEPLAQEVARLFCEKTVVYAKSRYRNGKAHDDFTEDLPRELPAAKSGRPYLKPVVCLLGPGCVSSGEGFAKMLAALPHVTTVGLPTRGSSGNPGEADVGETGVVVYFSRWVDLLPDGTPIEGKGVPVKVRIEVPAEAYKDADPTLAKGLEVLRGKLAGKK